MTEYKKAEERTIEEEIEWLRFIVKKKDEQIKRMKKEGRPKTEQKVRGFIEKAVQGEFSSYLDAHGDKTITSARSGLVKRIVGQLSSINKCRQFAQLVLDVEREIFREMEDLIQHNKEKEKSDGQETAENREEI